MSNPFCSLMSFAKEKESFIDNSLYVCSLRSGTKNLVYIYLEQNRRVVSRLVVIRTIMYTVKLIQLD